MTIIFFLIILILAPISANAQSMSNSNYSLNPSLLDPYHATMPKSEPSNIYTGDNYVVLENFEEDSKKTPLNLSISPTFIDYGDLSPANPVIRSSSITLSGTQNGASVLVYQDHNLRNKSSNLQIPDTTCDSGYCSPSLPSIWNNSLTYGFGYRCDNILTSNSCIADFENPSFYKSFPSLENKDNPRNIIETSTQKAENAKITYKINVSRAQSQASYSNKIFLIAIPRL